MCNGYKTMLAFVLLCAALGLQFHAAPLSQKQQDIRKDLFRAATEGDIETVRHLIETAAWARFSRDRAGMTPLIHAIQANRLELIPLLHPIHSEPCFALNTDAVRLDSRTYPIEWPGRPSTRYPHQQSPNCICSTTTVFL